MLKLETSNFISFKFKSSKSLQGSALLSHSSKQNINFTLPSNYMYETYCTWFSTSALCLTPHWNIPISDMAYVIDRPTQPGFIAVKYMNKSSLYSYCVCFNGLV